MTDIYFFDTDCISAFFMGSKRKYTGKAISRKNCFANTGV